MASKTTAKRAAPKNAVATSHDTSGQRYPTDRLLKSRHLSGYQPDFARGILVEPEYTIEEAKKLLDSKLKGED